MKKLLVASLIAMSTLAACDSGSTNNNETVVDTDTIVETETDTTIQQTVVETDTTTRTENAGTKTDTIKK